MTPLVPANRAHVNYVRDPDNVAIQLDAFMNLAFTERRARGRSSK